MDVDRASSQAKPFRSLPKAFHQENVSKFCYKNLYIYIKLKPLKLSQFFMSAQYLKKYKIKLKTLFFSPKQNPILILKKKTQQINTNSTRTENPRRRFTILSSHAPHPFLFGLNTEHLGPTFTSSLSLALSVHSLCWLKSWPLKLATFL